MSEVTAKQHTKSVDIVTPNDATKDAPPGAVCNLPSDDVGSFFSLDQKQKLLELCKEFVKFLGKQRFV